VHQVYQNCSRDLHTYWYVRVCSNQIQLLTIKKQSAVQYDGPPYLSVYQNTYTQAPSMNMTYYKCMFVFLLIMPHVDHLKKKTSNCTGMWCKNTKTVSSHHNRCHNSCTHIIKSKVSDVCAGHVLTTLELRWQISVKIQPVESKLFCVDRQTCQRQESPFNRNTKYMTLSY